MPAAKEPFKENSRHSKNIAARDRHPKNKNSSGDTGISPIITRRIAGCFRISKFLTVCAIQAFPQLYFTVHH
jgi:hypothetical protein